MPFFIHLILVFSSFFTKNRKNEFYNWQFFTLYFTFLEIFYVVFYFFGIFLHPILLFWNFFTSYFTFLATFLRIILEIGNFLHIIIKIGWSYFKIKNCFFKIGSSIFLDRPHKMWYNNNVKERRSLWIY